MLHEDFLREHCFEPSVARGDVVVAGGPLRMPVGGSFHMRPSNRDRKKETEGKLTFS